MKRFLCLSKKGRAPLEAGRDTRPPREARGPLTTYKGQAPLEAGRDTRPPREARGPLTGQALIEVLVAVSVLTVGLLGIITLLNRALSLNRVVSDNYTATYLAAEGIEVAKNIIDSNVFRGIEPWTLGITSGTYEVDYQSTSFGSEPPQPNPLFFDNSTRRYSYNGPTQTPFRRTVSVEILGTNEIEVRSEVTWVTRGGGAFNVELEDHFYNWRP